MKKKVYHVDNAVFKHFEVDITGNGKSGKRLNAIIAKRIDKIDIQYKKATGIARYETIRLKNE